MFGSYLSNNEKMGDIDLAVGLSPKIKSNEKRRELEKEKVREAYRRGRTFGNIVQELAWPPREVFLYLKSRSRSMSLHSIDDKILDQTECKVIYKDDE